MSSVKKAHAIIQHRLTGDREEAMNFLRNMSPAQRAVRNREETTGKPLRKRAPRVGERPKSRLR